MLRVTLLLVCAATAVLFGCDKDDEDGDFTYDIRSRFQQPDRDPGGTIIVVRRNARLAALQLDTRGFDPRFGLTVQTDDGFCYLPFAGALAILVTGEHVSVLRPGGALALGYVPVRQDVDGTIRIGSDSSLTPDGRWNGTTLPRASLPTTRRILQGNRVHLYGSDQRLLMTVGEAWTRQTDRNEISFHARWPGGSCWQLRHNPFVLVRETKTN